MTERKNQCFNCGSESHYARDCPDSNTSLRQRKKPPTPVEIHATTAERLVTSLGSVRSLKGKGPEEMIGLKGLKDLRGGTALREKEEIGVSDAKEWTDLRGLKRTEETSGLDAKKAFSATTARSTAISPETARMVKFEICRKEN
jgi:hypothetical protein